MKALSRSSTGPLTERPAAPIPTGAANNRGLTPTLENAAGSPRTRPDDRSDRSNDKPSAEWLRRADNAPLARFLYGFTVLAPLAALVVAVVQLWERAVNVQDLALLAGMYFLTAMGVTIGFHRYLTHRGFRAPVWLKIPLLILGSMALQGPAITWASTHLEHHARSDREGDPHTPVQGFLHAHLGWIVSGFNANPAKYGPWLKEDRVTAFISKTFWVWVVFSFLIPFAIGGWSGLLWGGLVRLVLVHHVTWSVNSVCHVFGQRPFKTGDRSTNHWLVGLLAGGEGWHNNHHAFQRSAFHGLYWWQFDLSGLIIRWLELAHVIRDVQRVDPERLARRQPLVDQLAPAAGPIGGAARHPAG